MSQDIVIIGSGFAARQLVKQLRQKDKTLPIRIIAADSCDEYNKPELSHVFSRCQNADDLTQLSAAEFADKNDLIIHTNTQVMHVIPDAHRIESNAGEFTYHKLVFATGAEAIRPPIIGSELMYTLNSQQEYRQYEQQLQNAERILLLGAGLIGSELAMDLNRAGKHVMLIDRDVGLLPTLMSPEISARLQHHLIKAGVEMYFNSEINTLAHINDRLTATLSNGKQLHCDAAICAIGLRPNIHLAQSAGLTTQRGIVVDHKLTTSHPDIFALGDCAEIQGKLMPYLQPAQLAAVTLATNLTGGDATLRLPPMLTKIKTPDLPIYIAGDTGNRALNWEMTFNRDGVIAKGLNEQGQLHAFVVTEAHIKQAIPLMKQLVA